MATTPTIEPATIVAGDTLTWQKSLADYPADTWTLKYRLLNATGKIDITATASGTDHLVSVSSATSAAYTAGDYDYLCWVEKGTGPTAERVSVASGRITVKPNLAALNTYDGRSNARIIYEGLVTAYKAAVTSRAFVAEYEIAGRRMKFNGKADWLTELNYWKAQVAAEDRAEKIADGLGGGARVLVRF
jgi:hypothetical protein